MKKKVLGFLVVMAAMVAFATPAMADGGTCAVFPMAPHCWGQPKIPLVYDAGELPPSALCPSMHPFCL